MALDTLHLIFPNRAEEMSEAVVPAELEPSLLGSL